MLAWDLFRRFLFSQRAGAVIRTIARLCIVGVAVGVFAFIVVMSVMNGFNRSIRDKLLAFEPHLVVSHPQNQNELIFDELHKDPARQVTAYEAQDVIVRTVEGLFGGAVAKGLEPKSLDSFMKRVNAAKKTKAEGNALPETFVLNPGEVAMGVDLARSLDIYEDDEVVIVPPETLLLPAGEVPTYEKVVVSRIVATDLPDVDAKLFFYNSKNTLLPLKNSASRTSGFEVRLPDPENFGDVVAKLKALGASVETWSERNSTLFFALRMEKIAMTTFLGLSALITCFSVITVLVLLMTQKRREIGMLMAMGLSPKKTKGLFLRVGLVLSGLGIGVGLGLGLLVSYVLDRYPLEVLPDIYYDSSVPAEINPEMVLYSLLGALIVVFIAAWLPVQAVIRMTPSEALKR